jgi:hypothetical protein
MSQRIKVIREILTAWHRAGAQSIEWPVCRACHGYRKKGGAKVRLSRVQRDRHDVPRLLVETAEGVEALLDFLMKSKQASRLTQGT